MQLPKTLHIAKGPGELMKTKDDSIVQCELIFSDFSSYLRNSEVIKKIIYSSFCKVFSQSLFWNAYGSAILLCSLGTFYCDVFLGEA